MLYWQAPQKWRLTSCNACWMLPLVWSAVHTGSTAACRGSYTLNYMRYIESLSQARPHGVQLSAQPSTAVHTGSTTACRGSYTLNYIRYTESVLNVLERVAFKRGLMVFNCLHNQAPLYLVDLCQSVTSVASDNIFALPAEVFLSCLAIVSAIMVGGLFLWPALHTELVTRQSERSGYQQRLLQAFTEDSFIFSLLVYIAHLSVWDDALYIFTYLLTYLLWTHDLENLISLWANCGTCFCKFWLKFF